MNETKNFSNFSSMCPACKSNNLSANATNIVLLYIFTVVNALGALPAVVLNLLIVVTLAKTPTLRIPANVLVIGLALADLGTGVFSEPSFCGYLVSKLKGSKEWMEKLLPAFHVSSSLFSTASLATVTAITIDRFLAISLHLRYQTFVTVRRTVKVLVAIWLVSIVFSSFELFDNETFKQVWNILYNIIVLAFILANISIMIRISYAVRKHSLQIRAHQKQLNIKQYKKSVNTMYFIMGSFAICSIPWWIYYTYFISKSKKTDNHENDETSLVLAVLFATLMNISSVLDPFLYFWRIQGMRQAVKDVLRNMWTSLKT